MKNDASTDDNDQEWKFREGDIIREIHEQFSPGGISLGKSEYLIERLLREESDGERFYYVQTDTGVNHLYSATVIEHSYETISTDESRVGFFDTGSEDGDSI